MASDILISINNNMFMMNLIIIIIAQCANCKITETTLTCHGATLVSDIQPILPALSGGAVELPTSIFKVLLQKKEEESLLTFPLSSWISFLVGKFQHFEECLKLWFRIQWVEKSGNQAEYCCCFVFKLFQCENLIKYCFCFVLSIVSMWKSNWILIFF